MKMQYSTEGAENTSMSVSSCKTLHRGSPQLLPGPYWIPRDAYLDPGSGRSRQNHHPLPVTGRRGCDHHPHHRVQCGASDIQESEVPSVGLRWPNKYQVNWSRFSI